MSRAGTALAGLIGAVSAVGLIGAPAAALAGAESTYAVSPAQRAATSLDPRPAAAMRLADDEVPDNLTPIESGPKAKSAVDLEPGSYVATTPDKIGDLNVWRVRRQIPGSTFYWGATLLSSDYTDPDRNKLTSKLLVRHNEDDSTPCGGFNKVKDLRAKQSPLITFSAQSRQNKPDCAEADEFYLAVWSQKEFGIEPGTPFQLDLLEVPPVENPKALDYGGAAVFGKTSKPAPVTQRVDPGTAKSTAPLLEPGTTTYVDAPTRSVNWFAVPVAFGEDLVATATIEDPDGLTAGSSAELDIISPVGGRAQEVDAPTDRPSAATMRGGTTTLEASGWVNTPSQIRDHKNNHSISMEAPANSLPGVYYVALYIGSVTADDGTTLPVRLSLQMPAYDSSSTQPSYAGEVPALPDPEGPAPEPFEDPGPGAATSKPAEESDSDSEPDAAGGSGGSRSWPAIGALGGLSVAFAAAGAVLLARARRVRSAYLTSSQS